MRDNFNQRYISLMKGKVSNFSLSEITFLLENLNGFEINTLCIQKRDNYYYLQIPETSRFWDVLFCFTTNLPQMLFYTKIHIKLLGIDCLNFLH